MITSVLGQKLRWHFANGWVFEPAIVGPDQVECTLKEGPTGRCNVIAHFASGESIVRYEPAPPMVGTTGDLEALPMWAGQSAALAWQPRSAAEIVAELVSGL